MGNSDNEKKTASTDDKDQESSSKTDGSKTDGSKTDGSNTNGSKTDGSNTDGSKTDGSRSEVQKRSSKEENDAPGGSKNETTEGKGNKKRGGGGSNHKQKNSAQFPKRFFSKNNRFLKSLTYIYIEERNLHLSLATARFAIVKLKYFFRGANEGEKWWKQIQSSLCATITIKTPKKLQLLNGGLYFEVV